MRHMMGRQWVVAIAVFGLVNSASAGWFGGGPKVDSNEQLLRLFGRNTAFSATAFVSVKGRSGKESHAAEMHYAMLDGKLRTELDMAKTKAGQKRAEGMEEMVAMGMNEMVTLIRPDLKKTYVIYPGLKAFCAMPIDEPVGGDATTDEPPPTIEKKELGKETVDGHPCIKSLVTITPAKGETTEMVIWEATDLNHFVIQTEVKSGSDTITTTFKDVKLEKPAAAVFEPPAGFKEYRDVQSMMMGAMQNMMGR